MYNSFINQDSYYDIQGFYKEFKQLNRLKIEKDKELIQKIISKVKKQIEERLIQVIEKHFVILNQIY